MHNMKAMVSDLPKFEANGLSTPATGEPLLEAVPFGREMRATHFLFDSNYIPLNNGSFGAEPKYVQKRMREVQDLAVARPDVFIRYHFPDMLDQSRQALADHLKLPVDDLVIINNASVGANTVLRNLKFESGDVILHFSTLYSGVAKTIESLKETTPVQSIKIKITYPLPDAEICDRFLQAVKDCETAGNRPRIAIFDTVSAMPGVRMPWEDLVKICRETGVLSLVDGAHGAGQLPLDIANVLPDFLVTNLHKWLFTPRATAAFYVPKRNQHLIRTTYPTSHGFRPLDNSNEDIIDSLPGRKAKAAFVDLFEFVGTNDNSAYLCIEAALKFRQVACGGEAKIMQYCTTLAMEAAERARQVWDTEIMETDRMRDSMMVQVALPLTLGEDGDLVETDGPVAANWMTRTLVKEQDVFALIFMHAGKLWVRFSAQIYLEMADFEQGIEGIADLCERIKKGTWTK